MTAAMNQIIPKGYKQTEVGVIPTDWQLRPLLNVVQIASGQVDPKNEPYRSMILVAPDHIESRSGRLLRKETAEEQNAISGKYLFEVGNIVYSKIRPYLRKAIVADFKGLCSADMYPLIPANDISAGFVFSVILGHHFSQYAESVSVRSGIPKINRTELADYLIVLPPTKAEQETIANALSDADALIEIFEKLIKKKKNIKQGVMQELLTGTRRLPGYTDKWETKKVGDIFRVTRGQVLSMTKTLEERIGEYKYPVYSSQTKNNGLAGYYKDYLFDNCITWTTDGANAGDVKYRAGKFYCTNVCGVLESGEGYSNLCVAAIFNSISKKYVSYVGNPKLMNNVVAGIDLFIPSSIKEQNAIASILSDMDSEIEKLESQLTKYRNLKQGMMQNLLTGKIRLIKQ